MTIIDTPHIQELATELNEALDNYLNAGDGGQVQGNAKAALERILWDNKSGIAAYLCFAAKPADEGARTRPDAADGTDANGVLQNDLREMLQALGMNDGAQPFSPHEVFQRALIEMKLRLAPTPPPPQPAPDALREALQRSIVAIDDWLNTYASDLCDPKHVEEAENRIGEYGTLAYIANVQEQNRAALAAPVSPADGAGEREISRIRAKLKTLCNAGYRCSCVDGNWQWYGASCAANMTTAMREVLTVPPENENAA